MISHDNDSLNQSKGKCPFIGEFSCIACFSNACARRIDPQIEYLRKLE